MTPRRWLAAGAVLLALVLLLGRAYAGWYVEHEWYASLGALPMWRARFANTMLLKGGSFLVALAFAFLNLWGVRSSVVQLVLPRRVGDIELGEQVPARLLFLVTLGLAVVLALLLAWLQEDWLALAQVRYAGEFGHPETRFGVDYGYWMTWLPFEQGLYAWAVAVLLVTGAVVIFLYAMTPSLRWERGTLRVSTWVRRHLTVLGAVVLILLAWSYRLDAYALALHGSGRGPGNEGAFVSVDQRWTEPATLGLALSSLSSAAVVLWAGWMRQTRVAVGTVLTLLVLSGIVRWAGPMIGPRLDGAARAEHARAYANQRATFTRYAFGLDRVQRADTAAAPPWVNDPAHEVSAVDAAALERTVERTHKAGQVRVGWQARPDGLWAMVVSAGDGGPTAPWMASRAPAWVGGPFIPRIPGAADGALTRDLPLLPALVHDSAAGYTIVSDSQGQVTGGALASGWGRLMHAWAQQNPRIAMADLPGAFPRIVLVRDVRERVRALAPFLEQGRVLTPILHADTLYWAIDLYTASAGFPFSRHVQTAAMGELAFLRHAGVAFIHAYTGRVMLVATAVRDPVLRGWMAAFPELFTPIERVAPALLDALPPPVDWVETQAAQLAATGLPGEASVSRHLPPIVAGDTLVAFAGPTLFMTGHGADRVLSTSLALLDALDRVQGIVVGTGGRTPRTWWVPVRSPEARWGGVVDALARTTEPLVASGAIPRGERTIPGRITAIPTAEGPWFVQPQYLWPVTGAPAVSHVALWRGGSASAARDLAAVLRGARPDAPVEPRGSPAWQARVATLYNQMRVALKKGDWSAFGEAFETLGRLTGQPSIR